MGLLSSSAASKGFGKAIKLLSRFHRRLGLLSYFASIVSLCLLASNDFNGKSYFSENALQPGIAATTFGSNDIARYDKLVRDLSKASRQTSGAIPIEFLTRTLSSLGLETHRQNFSVSHPFTETAERMHTGCNVFGVVRASRIASTESLVLAATWRKDNIRGVAQTITMGALMKKQSYWAKDIIVLIADQEVWGAEAWLEAYHGYSKSAYLQADSLPAWAGSIQAAICLDIASDRFSSFDILPDGINGQMPNLDLINLVRYLSWQAGVDVTFNGRGGHSVTQGNDIEAIQERLYTLLLGAAQQASMQPTGPHSSFVRYRIEALTIRTVSDWHTPHTPATVASIVESSLRSINNLLERFHQSFFFYLIASGDRYVSIGMYMPAAGLMFLPLILRALVLWFSCIPREETEDRVAETSKKQPVAFMPLPSHLSEVATVVLLVASSSFAMFISPWFVRSLPVPASDHVHIAAPLVCALIMFLLSPLVVRRLSAARKNTDESRSNAAGSGDFSKLLLCITIILWLAVLAVVVLINMPVAMALALPTVPALFLMPSSRARSSILFIGQCLLLALLISPPSLIVGGVALGDSLRTMQPPSDLGGLVTRAWLVWQHSALQYELLGIWLYPLLTLCVCPLSTLCWSVLWCPAMHTTKHEHID